MQAEQDDRLYTDPDIPGQGGRHDPMSKDFQESESEEDIPDGNRKCGFTDDSLSRKLFVYYPY